MPSYRVAGGNTDHPAARSSSAIRSRLAMRRAFAPCHARMIPPVVAGCPVAAAISRVIAKNSASGISASFCNSADWRLLMPTSAKVRNGCPA
jgi:hypothetical protein